MEEYTWDSADVDWSEVDLTFGEPWFIKKIRRLLKGPTSDWKRKGQPLDPKKDVFDKLEPEEKKKLIKLVCIVKGKSYKQELEPSEVDITISDIEFTITEVEKRLKIML
jgi:hypothetical protein